MASNYKIDRTGGIDDENQIETVNPRYGCRNQRKKRARDQWGV
jgi:hypothetical protein